MNDSGTGFSASRNASPGASFAQCACWARHWWLLGCLLAQVDCALSQEFTATNAGRNGGGARLFQPVRFVTVAPTSSILRWQWGSSASGAFTAISNNSFYSHNFQSGQFSWQAASSIPVLATFTGPNPSVRWFRCQNSSTGAVGPAYSITIAPSPGFLWVSAPPVGQGDGATNLGDYAMPEITFTLPPASMTADPSTGVLVDPSAGFALPPQDTVFSPWEGKKLAVPYYVPAGVDNVQVELGGQVYNFPVEIQAGDSGGVAMLDVPIPTNWDGLAKINGQSVNLGARAAYTGNPSMELYANPYSDRSVSLPPGMSWGVVDLPSGMTAGASLPLPSGVASVSSSNPISGTVPIATTKTDGTKTYTAAPTVSAVPVSSGGSSGGGSLPRKRITGGVVVGSTTTGNSLEDAAKEQAVLNATLSAPGEAKTAGTGFKNLGQSWDQLKTEVQNKFGAFRPLQAGGLPRYASLEFQFDAGAMGSHNISLDLTQSPFSVARALSLVLVNMHAAWFFLKFIKV